MKIFIAGGTSGIGAALATAYLRQGHEVAVCGRNTPNVEPAARGTSPKTYRLDIYDREALTAAVSDFAGEGLDMMILAAGSYADDSLHRLGYDDSVGMLKVNIAGAVNVLEAARGAMREGRIVVIASSSGLLSYKRATIYGSSKRALIQIADAYRRALADFGVRVTVVAPGYVDTPKLRELNGGDLSRKPFVVGIDEAMEVIMRAVAEKREMIVFPPRMKYLMLFLSHLPSWLLGIVMHRKAKWMNSKQY